MYPENTLLAFEKAGALKGLTGIELDIQLTRDGYMVVIHDETVDRTTNSTGNVRDYTLAELKKINVTAGDGSIHHIPTIKEVLDLLAPRLKEGLHINIELKNNRVPYEGMEEQIISLINARGLSDNIVYSSFNTPSVELVKQMDPNARIAILGSKVSDCLAKLRTGIPAEALHPFWQMMDVPAEELKTLNNVEIRAWFSGHLFPEEPTGTLLNLKPLEEKGITDVMLNEPERYV